VSRERAFAIQEAQVVDSPTEESKWPSLGLNWWAAHKGSVRHSNIVKSIRSATQTELTDEERQEGTKYFYRQSRSQTEEIDNVSF
jgi:hypothetical protein